MASRRAHNPARFAIYRPLRDAKPSHVGRKWCNHLTRAPPAPGLLPLSPGRPAWWFRPPGSHACGFSIDAAEQKLPFQLAGWEMAKLAWVCGLPVMQYVVLGGDWGEMASIRGIPSSICAYLPYGHDWTKDFRTVTGRLIFQVTLN